MTERTLYKLRFIVFVISADYFMQTVDWCSLLISSTGGFSKSICCVNHAFCTYLKNTEYRIIVLI